MAKGDQGPLWHLLMEGLLRAGGLGRHPDTEKVKARMKALYREIAQRTMVSAQIQELEERIRGLEASMSRKDDLISDLKGEIRLSKNTDEVTGLLKRPAFMEMVGLELSRAKRYDIPLSLVLIKFDRFEAYLKVGGQRLIDEALKTTSKLLKIAGRRTDIGCRADDRRIAVLLPNTSLDGALVFSERIREAIEHTPFPLAAKMEPEGLTASIGVAEAPAGIENAEDFYSLAANELKLAKGRGGNQVSPQVFSGRVTLS